MTHESLRRLADSLHTSCLIPGEVSGILRLTGTDRLDLLHRLSTNDLHQLKPGDASSTLFLTDKGRIVDFAHVLVMSDSVLLLTPGTGPARLKSWIEKYIIMEQVEVFDVTPHYQIYSVFGPLSFSTVELATGISLEPGRWIEARDGTDIMPVSWPGRDFVILIGPAGRTDISSSLRGSSEVSGPEETEAIRILLGLPGPGAELGPAFNPYDIGLRHLISFTKGCYIGQEVIARLDTYDRSRRHFVGMIFSGWRPGGNLPLDLGTPEREVGVVTSLLDLAGFSIGLGPVRKEFSPPATTTVWHEGGQSGTVQFVPLPFPRESLNMPEGA